MIVSSDKDAKKTESFIGFKAFKNCDRLGKIGNLVTHDIYMPNVNNLVTQPMLVEHKANT